MKARHDSKLYPGANDSLNQLRREATLIGVVGAVFAVLFVASLWLMHSAPRPRDGEQAFIDFYSGAGRHRIVLAGLYVLPLSAVAFIWFIAALRQWAAHSNRRGSQMTGTVQLVSGIAFITLGLASAASTTMPAALAQLTDDTVDPSLARDFPLFGNALLLIFGVRMAAMFIMTTTSLSLKSGLMPRWFAIVSLIVAVFLFLSASLSVWLAVLFPLWVLVLGVLIIVQAYQMGPDSPILQKMDLSRAAGSSQGDDVIRA